ncbi:MAG: EMC3/TMCO1 family protein, partial [Candidatus Bathyarchaeia archaeon]
MLPTQIPQSTIFIFLLAATISFLTSLVNRLLTDPQKTKAWRKEVMDWNTELRKAQKSGDKKAIEKLMKKQKQ